MHSDDGNPADAPPSEPEAWLPNLFTAETRGAMQAWIGSSPSRPFILQPALVDRLAAALAVELRKTTGWRYHHWARLADNSVKQVSEEEFSHTPVERRFSANHALSHEACDRDPGLVHVRALLAALGQGATAQLFSEVVGRPLAAQPAWEFARYVHGNFLAEHKDAFEGRRIGIILYFSSPNWQASWGGQLGYRNEAGEVLSSAPTFNTAAIVPFRTDSTHWVNRIGGEEAVRYAIAVHYLDEAQ